MIKKITRDGLVDMLCLGKDIKIVDVLDEAHYAAEHIKGAISLPLADIEKKAKRTLHKKDTIIVYCASFECEASTHAAEKLMSMGFTNVLDYKGGIKDFKEGGLPLEGNLHKGESKNFTCRCATC